MGTLATSNEVPIFERHPTLYLDDGDVVLQAPIASQGEKQKFQLFCIQKALLIAHSVVFANLFADASANLGSRCDGRPLISMPDEAFDLSHLLLYLADPSQYLLRSSHPDTALELYGAAKLADKYMMNTVRSAMVKRVAMDWPTTLDEWDARQTGIQNLRSKAILDRPRPGKRPRKLILALRTPEPVSAIMFAQAHDCPEILPAAFYRLATIDVANDWDLVSQISQSNGELYARWSLCDKENLLRYIRGRRALAEYHASVYERIKHGELLALDSCPSPDRDSNDSRLMEWNRRRDLYETSPCVDSMQALCDMGWGRVPDGSVYDPLHKLLELGEYDDLEGFEEACPAGLCSACEEALPAWVAKERKALWGRLGEYFKLK